MSVGITALRRLLLRGSHPRIRCTHPALPWALTHTDSKLCRPQKNGTTKRQENFQESPTYCGLFISEYYMRPIHETRVSAQKPKLWSSRIAGYKDTLRIDAPPPRIDEWAR